MPRDIASVKRISGKPVEPAIDHNSAVRVINDTLKGPVARIFRGIVPAFGDLSGGEFYDTVMGSSDLLHGCILILRRHPEHFRELLVDAKGRTVNDDFVRLACGRSLHDIIGMLVRTHAKRHFRSVLGGDPNDPTSRSGRMYQAMNEYLIHDWQVPLVPHYAPLPLHKVREMGPRLLDIREAELLDAIATAAGPTPPPLPKLTTLPLPEPGAHPTMVIVRRPAPPEEAGPQHTPQEEFWWDAITDRKVADILGPRNNNELRELVAALAGVNDSVRTELFAGLSLTTFQAATCLATAFRVMGRTGFTGTFGNPGKPAQIAKIATQMKKRGVSSRTDLKALVGHTEGALKG
ncbi:conserved hypothetical protein [Candidatus Terasakiella magnetica]|nr:conserved hypothetical protein [Candidatus Terasakiella magnetica]